LENEEGELKISFDIAIVERCETQKIFIVYRNQQTKIQLNCGVNLVGYYEFKTDRGQLNF
jgi:hypothetical protein